VSDNGRFVFGHAVCICALKLVKIKGKSSNRGWFWGRIFEKTFIYGARIYSRHNQQYKPDSGG
jgi:hypothetical protein